MSRKKSKKYKKLPPDSSDFFNLEDDAFDIFKEHVEKNTPPKKDLKSDRSEPLSEPPNKKAANAAKQKDKLDVHQASEPSSSDRVSSTFFDLEDNASELFKAHVENEKPNAKDRQEVARKPRQAKNRKRRGIDHEVTIDLHGLTTEESQRLIDETMASLKSGVHTHISLKIITGKGLHSPDGKAVLGDFAHQYIRQRYTSYISKIDDAPSDVTLRGLPIRGHFCVLLKM